MTTTDLVALCEPLVGRPFPKQQNAADNPPACVTIAAWWCDAAAALADEHDSAHFWLDEAVGDYCAERNAGSLVYRCESAAKKITELKARCDALATENERLRKRINRMFCPECSAPSIRWAVTDQCESWQCGSCGATGKAERS